MTHNIFGERFFGYRQPAWHGLGHVLETEQTAIEALTTLGDYRISLEPVRSESGLKLPYQAIIREPTSDDPHRLPFNVVGAAFELVEPKDVCQIWDSSTGRHVETMGALGRGETFFLTSELSRVDILGDEVRHFVAALAPMDGTGSVIVYETPVRWVCQNTIVLGIKSATRRYPISHSGNPKDHLARWLKMTYGTLPDVIAEANEFFNRLAAHWVTSEDVDHVLATIYPLPEPPITFGIPERVENATSRYLSNLAWAKTRRSLAQELFEGVGVGSTTEAARGTAWGLLNAVVELEDYFGADQSRYDYSRARDALTGYRANYKRAAAQAVQSLLV